MCSELSDPRNRNHKSLAITNHNFEVASFARRNRDKIAVSQSQKSHWAKIIAAMRNHTLVVATISGRFPDLCDASKTLLEKHAKLVDPESKELASEGVFSGVAPANQTEESQVRELSGRSPEFVPEPPFQNSPDRGQSRKIGFSKFPGSGLKKIE